jgi:hypothetical protein
MFESWHIKFRKTSEEVKEQKMKIELIQTETIPKGITPYKFRIPIDSESDTFLSGVFGYKKEHDDLIIYTNNETAETSDKLDIIYLVIAQVYQQLTNHHLTDAR